MSTVRGALRCFGGLSIVVGVLLGETHVKVTIARDASVQISNSALDKILQEASRVLRQNRSAPGECGVTLERQGPVVTLTGLSEIYSKEDFDRVSNLPGTIKFVKRIYWCEDMVGPGRILACTALHGRSIVLSLLNRPGLDSLLLAHEYGHMMGLPHRGSQGALMNPVLSPKNIRLTASECARLTSPLSGRRVSEREDGGLFDVNSASRYVTPPLLGVCSTSQPQSSSLVFWPLIKNSQCATNLFQVAATERFVHPVAAFVQQRYINGLPLTTVLRFRNDSRAINILRELMRRRQEQEFLPQIVVTLGFLGDRSTAVDLVRFLEGPTSDASSPTEESSQLLYEGRSAVPVAIGFIANRNQDDWPLGYLTDGTDPHVWSLRLHWQDPEHRSPDDLGLHLAALSIQGLGYSGTRRGFESLLRLQRLWSKQESSSGRQVSQVIDQAMKLSTNIRKTGLDRYLDDKARSR